MALAGLQALNSLCRLFCVIEIFYNFFYKINNNKSQFNIKYIKRKIEIIEEMFLLNFKSIQTKIDFLR